MKKRIISLILGAVMALCLVPTASAAAPQMQFELTVSDPTVALGDTVEVALVISRNGGGAFDINTMQDYIGFDTELFEFVNGSLWVFYDENENPMFKATLQKDEVFVNRFGYAPISFVDETYVVGFELRAVKLGETEITHSVTELKDEKLRDVDFTVKGASVEVIETDDNPADPKPNHRPKYGITVPADIENGTLSASATEARRGDLVTLTATPDEGFEVDKITVTTSKGAALEVTAGEDGAYTFVMPSASVVVDAAFKKVWVKPDEPDTPVTPEPPVHACPSEKYSDIDTAKWYHEACDFVIDKGIMNGFPEGVFMPDATTSRAMIATIIWRLAGEPEAKSASPFTDVTEGAWYYDAVCWASENGIVNGYGDGIFAPDDLITREQFAAMIYRYEQSKGGGFTGMWMFLLQYTDREDISDWAYEAMCWCSMKGVINGMGDGTVLPRGNATRAHAAQIIMNYITLE